MRRQRAHQDARASQLGYQEEDQLEIWRAALQREMAGARWTRAKVRAGGTAERKSVRTAGWSFGSEAILSMIHAVLSLAFYFLLLHAASYLPLFDASPLLLSRQSSLFRWDALHFLHIADHGYVFEHEWAFFPGAPLTLSLLLRTHALFSPAVLAVLSSKALYSLSLYHLRSPELARLASLLALLPTSPVTLYFAPYNEPFFTFLSYQGMLCCTRRQWFLASILFALAGAFRANGIFLGGFILWGMLVRPFLDRKMPQTRVLLKSIVLTAVVISPFVIHHIYAYSLFCYGLHSVPAWCHRVPPSLYTHVQEKYWNSGFLRYWTLDQLPNFLISTPTILLITSFSFSHLTKIGHADAKHFENITITPHVIHSIIFLFILVFASHTQIILRLAASMPVVYWAAAWLLSEHPSFGRLWVIWSVLWSVISTILWAAFLPPA
ncbi:hypothetical protein GALMADRAFT_249454 [Galerina marginata CBS 339.88]|uniref:GPI mannosyltransferase 2 n=1 Tax=Galerina marginata (strain CBS 339.88) TaxID=685588 RepID=A0A067SWY2_GALM3|nr:hypothetical protein GALMADRAFT_249454 [Galerina marginata CBS 339.88]